MLQERIVHKNNQEIPQVLVQWQNLSPLEATWEDVTYMQLEFSDFNLEDKVVVNGGSIDMSEQGRGAESARVDHQRKLDLTWKNDSQEEEHVEDLKRRVFKEFGRGIGQPQMAVRLPARYRE